MLDRFDVRHVSVSVAHNITPGNPGVVAVEPNLDVVIEADQMGVLQHDGDDLLQHRFQLERRVGSIHRALGLDVDPERNVLVRRERAGGILLNGQWFVYNLSQILVFGQPQLIQSTELELDLEHILQNVRFEIGGVEVLARVPAKERIHLLRLVVLQPLVVLEVVVAVVGALLQKLQHVRCERLELDIEVP